MRYVQGNFIGIHEMNIYFSHVTAMLLYYYDTNEHDGTVFILGEYVRYSSSHFRSLYPDKKLVVYQLEQLMGGVNWHSVSSTVNNLVGFDELWDFDPLNSKYLSWHDIKVDRIMPMRFVPELNTLPQRDDCPIDILFYGVINHRRFKCIREIQNNFYDKIKMMTLYGVFGKELDELISQSKIVLNLHAFEPYNRQEQVRIFYPLINGKCVLSEQSQTNYFEDMILEFTPQDLVSRIREALEGWKEIGREGAERFKAVSMVDSAYSEYTRKFVNASLDSQPYSSAR